MDVMAPEELGPQRQLRMCLDAPKHATAMPNKVTLDKQRPPLNPVPALRLVVVPDPSVDLCKSGYRGVSSVHETTGH